MPDDDRRRNTDAQVQELVSRGQHAFRAKQYDAAYGFFERAASIHPGCAEAHAWLAAVYGRRIEAALSMSEQIKLLSKLEEKIETALSIDSSLPLARRMNGAKLLKTPELLGGDPAEAAKELLYCIEQGMDDCEVWLLLAESYIKIGEPEKARDALKEAVRREPENGKAAEFMQQLQAES